MVTEISGDGRYLILQYPKDEIPTECPDCYSYLDSEHSTYNIASDVIAHVCVRCGLRLFLLPQSKKDHVFRGFVDNEEVEFTLASFNG